MPKELHYNKLRAVRLEARLSQRALQDLSDVTASTICAIEQGKKKPQDLTKEALAKALEVPVESIFPSKLLVLTPSDFNKLLRTFKQSREYAKLKRRTLEEILNGLKNYAFGSFI